METPLPMGGCMEWWVDGWEDGWGHVKSLKTEYILNLIEIFRFFIKIYDLWRLCCPPTYPPTHPMESDIIN